MRTQLLDFESFLGIFLQHIHNHFFGCRLNSWRDSVIQSHEFRRSDISWGRRKFKGEAEESSKGKSLKWHKHAYLCNIKNWRHDKIGMWHNFCTDSCIKRYVNIKTFFCTTFSNSSKSDNFNTINKTRKELKSHFSVYISWFGLFSYIISTECSDPNYNIPNLKCSVEIEYKSSLHTWDSIDHKSTIMLVQNNYNSLFMIPRNIIFNLFLYMGRTECFFFPKFIFKIYCLCIFLIIIF